MGAVGWPGDLSEDWFLRHDGEPRTALCRGSVCVFVDSGRNRAGANKEVDEDYYDQERCLTSQPYRLSERAIV